MVDNFDLAASILEIPYRVPPTSKEVVVEQIEQVVKILDKHTIDILRKDKVNTLVLCFLTLVLGILIGNIFGGQ
jgi:hypothetical protein